MAGNVAVMPVRSPFAAKALSASGSGSYSNPYYKRSAAGSSSLGSGAFGSSSYNSLFKQLQQIQAQNNAWSAAQADKQMAFQQASAREAMQFNADQAELSRQWQEMMSNTAHQREIKDLQAAGLNPVLSAMGGSGAPVTSGATASGYSSQGAKGDTDTSLSGALVSLFGSMLQSQTAIANQAVSARTQEAIADRNNSTSRLIAELQSQTQLNSATIAAAASQYAADRHVDASYLSAQISAAAQRYGYDLNAMTQRQIASFNADVNRDLARMGYEHDFNIKEAFPSTQWQAMGSILGQLFGNGRGWSMPRSGSAKSTYREYASGRSGGSISGGRSR